MLITKYTQSFLYSSNSLDLSKVAETAILFIAQLGRQLDIDIVSSADVLVLKNLATLTGYEQQ